MADPHRPVPEARFQEPRYRDVEDVPDLEDALAEYLAHHPLDEDADAEHDPFSGRIPVRGGPALDPQTEYEYEQERKK
ncbi:hypothetical protein ABT340_41300 [Streptosporangium sp. NPDC000239]|uniref:hypothetical protein n=1 Tax=Streptosporangium sp. NPDC000239 TaxID=3154248 RepID=UPI00331A1F93